MLDSLDTLIAFVLIMLVVSLLITIAVQIVAAALNLRGLNLLNGMSTTFALIAPDIGENASELARCVLKGRLVSDSFLPDWPIFRWWRHTTAMRPAEIFDAIHRIAVGRKQDVSQTVMENARALLVALGVDEATLNEAAKKITDGQTTATAFLDNASKSLEALVPDAALRTKVQTAMQTALDDAKAKLASAGIAAADTGFAAAGAMDDAYKKFQYWTDICQERVQQWFAMHTRIITVVFAFVFAFWLQIDSVEIFKLVSSNKAVRDKLVAQAATVEAQASRTLGESNSVLRTTLKEWSEKETDPAIKTALAGVEVKDTDTREAVRDKVAQALKDKKPANNFDSMVNATATDRIKTQGGDFKTVQADFEKTGFDLFPRNGRFRWGASWDQGFNDHLVGMLFSVGLLSLGAPFWYNALKNLMSLRSTVAQNISKEKKQEEKQDAPTKAEAPPTVK